MKKLILLVFSHFFTSALLYAMDEFEMKEGETNYILKKYYFCFLKEDQTIRLIRYI